MGRIIVTKLEIKILQQADYLHFGSLKVTGFENLTFRFDTTGKLMPDFWDDRNGYHELNETGDFYQSLQQSLRHTLLQ